MIGSFKKEMFPFHRPSLDLAKEPKNVIPGTKVHGFLARKNAVSRGNSIKANFSAALLITKVPWLKKNKHQNKTCSYQVSNEF